MASEPAPTHITYNPVYQVTYEGSDPTRGYVYVKADTRPAPAATDTGLVTVSPKDYDFYEDGELVTRSQAEELLAAERAEANHQRRERVKEWERANALEAKLAAAHEALEPFAAVFEDYDPDWEDDDVTAVLVVGSVTHYGITLGDFRQARAVLGGKPS